MIDHEDIGGAFVRRTIWKGAEISYKPGTTIPGDAVRGFGHKNLHAMIDSGQIQVWPKPPVEMSGDRAIVHIGGGRYDVFVGKLNSEPLTKDEAEELATRPDQV
jgi:hypothetical protein